MSDVAANNKRIAKNTLILYVRMFLVMLVSLYTSRVVLNTLGVVDFGIYNVVGGIVAMVGLLNGALGVATQRYITYELGRGDPERLRKVFSISLFVFILFALLVIIFAETIGLWFLHNKMVIPEDKMRAAEYIYQYSIISFVLTLLTCPHNAAIVAHEKMNVYAYISILETVMKLVIVFLLLIIPADRLITYGTLVMLCNVLVAVIYVLYSFLNFPETRYKFYWDAPLFKELVSYSGWNMFGSVASAVKGQGLNILLNMFFDPAVNAARGIACQVNSVSEKFFSSFYTAVRPQITKYYAAGEVEEMIRLVFRSAKISFFLILLVSMPIILETPYIINLWLGQLPNYAVPFARLTMIITAVDAMATPLMTVAHATGKIKLYQSTVGTMIILNLPISYIFLKLGAPAITVFYVSVVISMICLFMRLWIVKRLVNFPVKRFIIEVLGVCVLVTCAAAIIPTIAHLFLNETFINVVIVCMLSVSSCAVAMLYIGFNRNERDAVLGYVKGKICRKK